MVYRKMGNISGYANLGVFAHVSIKITRRTFVRKISSPCFVRQLERTYANFAKKTTCLQEFRFLAGRWFFVGKSTRHCERSEAIQEKTPLDASGLLRFAQRFYVDNKTDFRVWGGYDLEAEEAAALRLSLTTRILSSKQSSQTFKFPTLSLYSGLPHTEHSRS